MSREAMVRSPSRTISAGTSPLIILQKRQSVSDIAHLPSVFYSHPRSPRPPPEVDGPIMPQRRASRAPGSCPGSPVGAGLQATGATTRALGNAVSFPPVRVRSFGYVCTRPPHVFGWKRTTTRERRGMPFRKPRDKGVRRTDVTTETMVAGTATAPLTVEWDADHAVTELYREHYRPLVRLAALLVRDYATAEEVVQDSFVAMHGAWRRLRDPNKALSYLRQAVVNKARSVLRHRAVVEKHAPKALPDAPSAENGAMNLLEREAVIKALRKRPTRQREAIVLRYYGDLSEAQIADAMKISRGAVKSHTPRGISALRSVLEQPS